MFVAALVMAEQNEELHSVVSKCEMTNVERANGKVHTKTQYGQLFLDAMNGVTFLHAPKHVHPILVNHRRVARSLNGNLAAHGQNASSILAP